jgi:hypothetical protein
MPEGGPAPVKPKGKTLCEVFSAEEGARLKPISTTRLLVKALKKPTTDEERLNKTEKAWLQEMRTRGLKGIRIMEFTLKLADDTRYTPDFSHIAPDGRLVFYEVKGWFRDDAKVKIKVAARKFSEFDFVLVRKTKNGWTEDTVKP